MSWMDDAEEVKPESPTPAEQPKSSWMEGAEEVAPEKSRMERLGTGAVEDVKNLGKGIKTLATDVLPDLAKTAAFEGTIPATIKAGKLGWEGVKGTAEEYKNLLTHPIEHATDHPVNTALDVLPFAGLLGKIGKVAKGVAAGGEEGTRLARIAEMLKKGSREQNLKALTPNPEKVRELLGNDFTPERALELGDVAKKEGIISPYRSPEGMLKATEPIEKGLGKELGDIRMNADLRDITGQKTPSLTSIVKKANEEIAPKYTEGVQAGEVSDFNRAIDELHKLSPIKTEMATESLPSYIDDAAKTPEGYQKFRKAGEEFAPRVDEPGPNAFDEYTTAPEGHTLHNLSEMATNLNDFAKKPGKLLQPNEAAADVANLVSRETNNAINSLLSPEEQANYLKKRGDFSKIKQIHEILKNPVSRDLTNPNPMPTSIPGVVKDTLRAIFPPSALGALESKLAGAAAGTNAKFMGAMQGLDKYTKFFQGLNTMPKAVALQMIRHKGEQDPEFKKSLEALKD